jgi:hypothetical protein
LFAIASFTAGPAPRKKYHWTADGGVVRELVLEIVPGLGGGAGAAADEGTVADADPGVADADEKRAFGTCRPRGGRDGRCG